jgi:hypothetical protein
VSPDGGVLFIVGVTASLDGVREIGAWLSRHIR